MKSVVQPDNSMQSQRQSEICAEIMFALDYAANQILILTCFGWKISQTGIEAVRKIHKTFYPNDRQIIDADSVISILRQVCRITVDIWAGVAVSTFIPNEDELDEVLNVARSIDESNWFELADF